MSTEKFFKTLFSGKNENDFILIWEKFRTSGMISFWTRDVAEAAHMALKLKHNDSDVYFGCCTSPLSFGKYDRCISTRVAGMPGVWLDVDCHHVVAHKNENKKYPKTLEEIHGFMKSFPLEPSYIISSGHGYHYYWLLDKFWNFANDEERIQGAALEKEFIRTFGQYFRVMGYDLDPIYDFARVLRPPGTFNRKDIPVETSVSVDTDLKYSIMDLKLALTTLQETFTYSPGPVSANVDSDDDDRIQIGTFNLDPNVKAPDRITNLLAKSDKFAATWTMQRRDFKGGESASEYDFSLANFALYNNWTWQEAIDLMIAFRRKHGLKSKFQEKYYINTLEKVASTLKHVEAMENLDLLTGDGVEEDMPKDRRIRAINNNVSAIVGVEIEKIIKYATEPAIFKILFGDGRSIKLPNINHLIEFRLFRAKIMEVTVQPFPILSKERWANSVVPALLAAVEEEGIGEDSTDRGLVADWLYCYLSANTPQYDGDEAVLSSRPFFQGDHLYIQATHLRPWLLQMRRESIGNKIMGVYLKEYGMKPKPMMFRLESGKHINRNIWSIPITDSTIKPFVNYNLLDDANRLRAERPVMVGRPKKPNTPEES